MQNKVYFLNARGEQQQLSLLLCCRCCWLLFLALLSLAYCFIIRQLLPMPAVKEHVCDPFYILLQKMGPLRILLMP